MKADARVDKLVVLKVSAKVEWMVGQKERLMAGKRVVSMAALTVALLVAPRVALMVGKMVVRMAVQTEGHLAEYLDMLLVVLKVVMLVGGTARKKVGRWVEWKET